MTKYIYKQDAPVIANQDTPQEVTPEQFQRLIAGTWLGNLGGVSQLAELRYFAQRDWDIEAFSGAILPDLDAPVEESLHGQAQIAETVTTARITGLGCYIHYGRPCVLLDVEDCCERGVVTSDIGQPSVESFRYDRPEWKQRYLYISGDSLIEAPELNAAGGIAFLEHGNLTILSREPYDITRLNWNPTLGTIVSGAMGE